MTTRHTPRARRGAEAVMAAVEAFELSQRLDEPDGSFRPEGDLDLSWARNRIETARQAAAADVVTAEEALEWLAATMADELDVDVDDDRWEPEQP
jgi:hypothetical protein